MKILIVEKTTIHYSKKYGSLTRITRLKVAINMADPTCLLDQFVPVLKLNDDDFRNTEVDGWAVLKDLKQKQKQNKNENNSTKQSRTEQNRKNNETTKACASKFSEHLFVAAMKRW